MATEISSQKDAVAILLADLEDDGDVHGLAVTDVLDEMATRGWKLAEDRDGVVVKEYHELLRR
jgi:hypothetical protein